MLCHEKKNITPGSKEVKTFKLVWYLSVWTSETDFDYCHILLSFITLVCLAPEVKFTEETNIRLTWLPQWEQHEAEDKWFTKSWQNLLILKCAGLFIVPLPTSYPAPAKKKKKKMWTFGEQTESGGVFKSGLHWEREREIRKKKKCCLMISDRFSGGLFIFSSFDHLHLRSW